MIINNSSLALTTGSTPILNRLRDRPNDHAVVLSSSCSYCYKIDEQTVSAKKRGHSLEDAENVDVHLHCLNTSGRSLCTNLDYKTNVPLHIVSNMSRSKHSYDFPVFVITNFQTFLLRSPVKIYKTIIRVRSEYLVFFPHVRRS
jgi:hypothetical protein